jgi:acid phosphatase class B
MGKKIIVVDIDGTIAKVGEHQKFLEGEKKDWDAFFNDCDKDIPITPIIDLVNNLENKYKIVFCTGRSESVKNKTILWLFRNFKTGFVLDWCTVLMRQLNDHRPDTVVKPELLQKAGIDFNDIAFVLEDRNCMVRKWRELGLTCLQVNEWEAKEGENI